MANEVMAQRYADFQTELGDRSTMELGRAMVETDKEIETKKEELAVLNSKMEWISHRLADKMAEDEVPNFTIAGRRINTEEKLNVSAPEKGGILDRVMAVVEDFGGAGIIKRTIAPATLKAHVRALLDKQKLAKELDPQFKALTEAGLSVKIRTVAKFYGTV